MEFLFLIETNGTPISKTTNGEHPNAQTIRTPELRIRELRLTTLRRRHNKFASRGTQRIEPPTSDVGSPQNIGRAVTTKAMGHHWIRMVYIPLLPARRRGDGEP